MRYTTIIDIREIPEVWKNQNVRLLYLQLVLMAGYHDNDRDIVRVSLRNLATSTGLTLSATRHAIAVLIKWRLLQHKKSYFKVVKFIEGETITPRGKTAKEAKQKAIKKQEETRAQAIEQAAQDAHNIVDQIYESGKTPFMVYFEKREAEAAAGDRDAARYVEENRATYLAHQSNIKNKRK